ncbi:MAG: hypothetical protein AB7O68_00905 [Pirellulales bacterium]
MLPFDSASLPIVATATHPGGFLASYYVTSPQVVATLLAAIVALILLLVARPRLMGTTLVAPWWWSISILGIVTGLEVVAAAAREMAAGATPAWTTHLELVAGALTFCPTMALLGAKRPQDRAWQFVVLSLAVVLVLPAAEGALFRPATPLVLHAARRWFLLILLAVTLATGLPTRRWLATALLVAGQILLLGDHLPGGGNLVATLDSWRVPAGMSLLAVALFAAAHPYPRQSAALAPWDRAWLDFRDAFGTLWGLRVAERFNDTARRSSWPVRLKWSGFEFDLPDNRVPGTDASAPLSPRGSGAGGEGARIEGQQHELMTAMRVAMASLLWRFVSDDWLLRRWPVEAPTPDLRAMSDRA